MTNNLPKTEDKNKELKVKFLEYFRQLPIQKLAAASIGKSEDTITDWKRADSDFSDQIEQAKAEWALSNIKRVQSREWLLERLMNDHFGGKEAPGGVQNNFFNLTDDQLDTVIKSKIRQIGDPTIIDGETTEDSGESTEVR